PAFAGLVSIERRSLPAPGSGTPPFRRRPRNLSGFATRALVVAAPLGRTFPPRPVRAAALLAPIALLFLPFVFSVGLGRGRLLCPGRQKELLQIKLVI